MRNGPSLFGFIFLLCRVFMFLESNHTFSPFLNGIKVDFRLSAMRERASSCAAKASSRFLINVFILSLIAGNFVFSKVRGRAIRDSPNMSSKGDFCLSVCHRLL